MKFKYIILILVFIFTYGQAKAEPRCETFFKKLYKDTSYPTDADSTDIRESSIGFNLRTKYDEEKESFVLKKNINGFYIVGKITQIDLIDKIQTGDIILSINNKDIRNTFKEDDVEAGYISDLYKENEKINLKLLRNLPKGKTEVVNIETISQIHDFDNPAIDFLINNIDVNEKKGSFDLSFTGEFSKFYYADKDPALSWNIAEIAHQTLARNIKDGSVLKDEDYLNVHNINTNPCFFSENEWKKLNAVDPSRGIAFANIVSENINNKKSHYLIEINFNRDARTADEIEKNVYVEYFYNSSLTLKNDFNLKNFPFDKQTIEVFIYQKIFPLNRWKAYITSFTEENAMAFMKKNSIQGWDIKNFNLEYKIFDDPYYGKEFDGVSLKYDIERKSGYYIFKIIIPIILILMVCWSAVWINPREIESRLTVTIVCLLSLIAYNFVIDSDMPKLEYLTIMDYIILVSYIYATIPNFLSIYSFQLIKKNKALAEKYESYEKKYGLPSYILIVLLIILFSVNASPEYTSSMFSWAAIR